MPAGRFLIASALLAGSANSAVADEDIRPVLRAQGFYAPLNGREQIAYAGEIREGADRYQVYIYRGVFKPHPRGVDHGVNKLTTSLRGAKRRGNPTPGAERP